MKKISKLIFIVLLIALSMVALTACPKPRPSIKQYTVTVDGGTGGGKYDEGTEITISPTVPAGMVFVGWKLGGEIINADDNHTFSVTKDISYEATFRAPTEGFTFNLLADDTYELTLLDDDFDEFVQNEDNDYMVLPSHHEGKPITRIGDYAFRLLPVRSAIIPSTVKIIGEGAFQECRDLSGIKIPSSVIEIEDYAFSYCDYLEVIVFVGQSKIEKIGKEAFINCLNLLSLDIPKSLKSMEWDAFAGSYQLANITVEEGNESYKSIDGVLYNKSVTELLLYPAAADKDDFVLPATVTKIITAAFMYAQVKNVVLNNVLAEIASYAFFSCSINSITIPSNVTKIGTMAFSECENLVIFCEPQGKPENWVAYTEIVDGQFVNYGWNPSLRPVFWGCTLSSDKTYVESFVKSDNTADNLPTTISVLEPSRAGYKFAGWSATPINDTTELVPLVRKADYDKIVLGTTLYSVWLEKQV